MKLQECYIAMNGDYEDVLRRISREKSVVKFLRRFAENKEFEELEKAVSEKNYQRVFELSHDIKGMAANLSISGLQRIVSEICEQTRDREPDGDLDEMMLKAKEEYGRVIAAIGELEDIE